MIWLILRLLYFKQLVIQIKIKKSLCFNISTKSLIYRSITNVLLLWKQSWYVKIGIRTWCGWTLSVEKRERKYCLKFYLITYWLFDSQQILFLNMKNLFWSPNMRSIWSCAKIIWSRIDYKGDNQATAILT